MTGPLPVRREVEYYDRDGQPIGDFYDYMEWLKQFPDRETSRDYKRVGLDKRAGVTVSTVWLGMNHNWFDGPPQIFETMVFGGDHDEDQSWRYSTLEQARAGHAEVCSVVLGGQS